MYTIDEIDETPCRLLKETAYLKGCEGCLSNCQSVCNQLLNDIQNIFHKIYT